MNDIRGSDLSLASHVLCCTPMHDLCLCTRRVASLRLSHCMRFRYARPEDNLLAAGCQLTLIFCFIGSGYIRLYEAIVEQVSAQTAANVMVFASTTVIALPLVVVATAMLVLMFVIMALLVRKEGHQPIVILAETGLPPLLTFFEGQKWHLFLSHTWSTSQE